MALGPPDPPNGLSGRFWGRRLQSGRTAGMERDDGPRPDLASPEPSVPSIRQLYACTGKHCRKKKKVLIEAIEGLEPSVRIETVGCQKICSGPVIGAEVDGQLEWFERVDTPKSRAALRRLTETGELGKPLRNRRVSKRRNKKR
jgi:(2Fe-2S) ferredoxin